MAIEANCPGCNRLLRVADEHAGKQARCPACNTIYVVPGEPTTASPTADERPPGWYLRTPEARVFGPVDRETLDTWVSQGRVTADCRFRTDEELHWRPADEIYGILRAGRPQRAAGPRGTASLPRGPATTPFRSPHRGVLVILLGIFGWMCCCPIFSIIAWSVGTSDLREMQLGRMDPAGQGLTRAGRLLGMIHTLICLGLLLLGFFALILAAFA